MLKFKTATEAFEYFFDLILKEGSLRGNTRVLFNQGFLIENPLDNLISTPYRKWSDTYAKREWNWYLSGNPDATEIAKHAPIWKNMMHPNGSVNSNYGYQWMRNDQLEYAIHHLRLDSLTRKAAISIFDGKEYLSYSKDTPCTHGIDFTIEDGKLCMTVMMRSNDLVFGFCNDQYCFSMLQEMVAERLELELGWYYHFATNLHIYDRHYNLKSDYEQKI